MFFIRSKRHDTNYKFENMLKKIKFERITNNIMNFFYRRKQKYDINFLNYNNTILISLKSKIRRINNLLFERYCFFENHNHFAINRKNNRILKFDQMFRTLKKISIF